MSDHQPNPRGQIFRQEAIDHHLSGAAEEATLPDAPPAWTQWAFVFLLVGIAASALILIYSGAITLLMGRATS